MLTRSKRGPSGSEEIEATPSSGASPNESPGPAVPLLRRGDAIDETILEGLRHTFVAFGLSAREALLYVTLADRGTAIAREIIRESGVDRATSYRILDRLEARGLAVSDHRWPARYSAVGIPPMLDRMSSLLRDEIELLQSIRALYERAATARDRNRIADNLGQDAGGAVERTRLLGDQASSVSALVAGFQTAREEIAAIVRPGAYRRGQGALISHSMSDALNRGVRLRLVLNFRPGDLKFLANLKRSKSPASGDLEVRFFVPQLSHFYLTDRRTAIRFLGFPNAASQAPVVGLESNDGAFVRTQLLRFRAIWNQAAPELRSTSRPRSMGPARAAGRIPLPGGLGSEDDPSDSATANSGESTASSRRDGL